VFSSRLAGNFCIFSNLIIEIISAGCIFVTSPDIHKPRDLIGKRIMGTAEEIRHSSLASLLNHFKINGVRLD